MNRTIALALAVLTAASAYCQDTLYLPDQNANFQMPADRSQGTITAKAGNAGIVQRFYTYNGTTVANLTGGNRVAKLWWGKSIDSPDGVTLTGTIYSNRIEVVMTAAFLSRQSSGLYASLVITDSSDATYAVSQPRYMLNILNAPEVDGGDLDTTRNINWLNRTFTSTTNLITPDGTTVTAITNSNGGLTLSADASSVTNIASNVVANIFTADGDFMVGTGDGTYTVENGATARASLGLTIGTDVLAPDGDGSGLSGVVTSESDPIWAAVSNTVTTGAAAGATATQPGDAVTTLTGTPHRMLLIDSGGSVNELIYGVTPGHILTSLGSTTPPQWQASDWSAVSNAVTANAANGATAYGWGNHATNDYAATTGDTMTGPLLTTVDHLTTAPAADEFGSAAWTRSLLSFGKTAYMTTNLYPAAWTPTNTTGIASYDNPTSNSVAFAVGAVGTYIASLVDTNPVAADIPLAGPATVHIHLGIAGGVPSANYTLSVKPELYYTYSLAATNLTLGDFDADPQTWTSGQTTAKTFAIAWPTAYPTNIYYRVWRLKVTAKGSAINTCTIGIGGTDTSYVTFSTAGAEASAVAADLATHEGLDADTAHGETDPVFVAAQSTFLTNNGVTVDGVGLTNGSAITSGLWSTGTLSGVDGVYVPIGTNNYWIMDTGEPVVGNPPATNTTTTTMTNQVEFPAGISINGEAISSVDTNPPPVFHAYLSADSAALTRNTDYTVAFNTVIIDSRSAYDAANYRYYAPVAGYYRISACIKWELIDGVSSVITKLVQAGDGSRTVFGWVRNQSTAGNTIIESSCAAVFKAPSTNTYWTVVGQHGNSDDDSNMAGGVERTFVSIDYIGGL